MATGCARWSHDGVRASTGAQEALHNAFEQFTVPLSGVRLHYLHSTREGPSPLQPLPLLHGWPGSGFKFLDILPRLTHPSRFGGAPADAQTMFALEASSQATASSAPQPHEAIQAVLARKGTPYKGL